MPGMRSGIPAMPPVSGGFCSNDAKERMLADPACNGPARGMTRSLRTAGPSPACAPFRCVGRPFLPRAAPGPCSRQPKIWTCRFVWPFRAPSGTTPPQSAHAACMTGSSPTAGRPAPADLGSGQAAPDARFRLVPRTAQFGRQPDRQSSAVPRLAEFRPRPAGGGARASFAYCRPAPGASRLVERSRDDGGAVPVAVVQGAQARDRGNAPLTCAGGTLPVSRPEPWDERRSARACAGRTATATGPPG